MFSFPVQISSIIYTFNIKFFKFETLFLFQYETMLENTIKLNAREFRMPVKPVERDIVAVLAKVKKQVRFQASDFQIASTVTHRDKRRTYTAATSLSLSSSSIFCIFLDLVCCSWSLYRPQFLGRLPQTILSSHFSLE